MPRAPVRPSPSEIEAIERALMESDLQPAARRRLRAVREWAKGKTSRQVAAVAGLGMSDFTVCSAVRAYRKDGLSAFTAPTSRGRGATPVPAEKVSAIERELRESIRSGVALAYRSLAAKYSVSLGKVAEIAKNAGQDASRRRGQVAPRTTA